MKWIYKITYPNGRIYIGKDLTGTPTYFGSPNPAIVGAGFSFEELKDFSIRRQILWHSDLASNFEVNTKEVEFIRRHQSNNPRIGYNRWPKFPPNLST